MGEGGLVARGAPEDLIDKIRGAVYRKIASKSDLQDIEKNHKVISTQIRPSGVRVSIHSTTPPGDDFALDDRPVLEDAYFAHLYKFV